MGWLLFSLNIKKREKKEYIHIYTYTHTHHITYLDHSYIVSSIIGTNTSK